MGRRLARVGAPSSGEARHMRVRQSRIRENRSAMEPTMKTLQPVLAIVLALVCTAAGAASHYQWRDGSGRMVYSDMPPPSDVKAVQILRRPPSAPAAADSQPAVAPSAPSAATPGTVSAPPAPTANAAPGNSIVERDAQFRKRRTERMEAETKQQEKTLLAEKTARACEDMRASLRTLESGARVNRVDANGVRQFVSDVERAQHGAELRRTIAQDCKTE